MTDIGSRAGLGKAQPVCIEADLLLLQIASEDGSAYYRHERISGWSQLTGPEKTLESAVPKRVLSRYLGGRSQYRIA